ncbi:MAG: maleylacetate reductase [Yoonia sp.]|nr:maleylacetate reductase [Yoonia sp.]
MTGLAKYQRVLFGVGVRNTVADEVRRLGCSRALILSTPPQSSSALDLAAALNDMSAGVFSRAAMHTPVEVTEDALRHVQEINAECLIAIGGGSTTGLGKAIAHRTGLPQIVIPTTYAGSEATPILGQTEDGVKTTLTDRKVLPEVILYDPELVATLPVGMTVTSALNAMAHAAEALYARDKSEDSNQLAIDGLTSFVKSLPKVLQDPEDLAAREETQRGAWACGAVLGRVGMALHHKLCHTLGGSFDLPHAETHAIILPHAIHYNAQAVPGLLAPVTDLLGGSSPGMALWQFAKSMGAPLALRDLGLQVQDLDRVAEIATRNPYWNPREVTADGIRALLEKAWTGEAPGP